MPMHVRPADRDYRIVVIAIVCETIRELRSCSVQSAWGCAGTPVQNSMEELFGIMNVLDDDKYSDEADFLARFGKGMPTPEQVQDLQVLPSATLPACQTSQPGIVRCFASVALSRQEAFWHRPKQVQGLQVAPSAAVPACQITWHFCCIQFYPS